MGLKSTSVEANASTSADGFMELISGKTAAAAPTPAVAQAVSTTKSRRVVSAGGVEEFVIQNQHNSSVKL
jgi:hypothetical protein